MRVDNPRRRIGDTERDVQAATKHRLSGPDDEFMACNDAEVRAADEDEAEGFGDRPSDDRDEWERGGSKP